MKGTALHLTVTDRLAESVLKRYRFSPQDRDLLTGVGKRVQNAVREGARFWVRWDGNGRRDRADAALTLGGEVDALQEGYAREDRLLECYMAEVFSDELMRLACGQLNEWILENAGLRVARYRFFGADPQLPLEDMPGVLSRVEAEGIRCNPAFCLIPKKSLVFEMLLSPDPETSCAAICSGCGRKNCPNRNEEENGG